MFDQFTASLVLLVVGMGGVFISLLALAGMIWLFKAADEWLNQRRIRQYAETAIASGEPDGINDELVAVITAAATAAAERSVRVRKVRFLSPIAAGAWASSGRLNVMASHQISRRKT
jgi:hypothetical protein